MEMSTDQRPLVIGTTQLMGKHMYFPVAAKGIPFKSERLFNLMPVFSAQLGTMWNTTWPVSLDMFSKLKR